MYVISPYRPAPKSGLLGNSLPVSKLANKENEAKSTEAGEKVDSDSSLEQSNFSELTSS